MQKTHDLQTFHIENIKEIQRKHREHCTRETPDPFGTFGVSSLLVPLSVHMERMQEPENLFKKHKSSLKTEQIFQETENFLEILEVLLTNTVELLCRPQTLLIVSNVLLLVFYNSASKKTLLRTFLVQEDHLRLFSNSLQSPSKSFLSL